MNTNMIIAKLSTKNKGQFFKMSYASDLPLTAMGKAKRHTVFKYTYGTFRYGIRYKNLKSVKERDGDKNIKHELSWGVWDPQNPGLIILHKGQEYVRLYSSPNKMTSTYYLDGRPIALEELKAMGIVQNSYWNKKHGVPECFTIKAGNIQEIW